MTDIRNKDPLLQPLTIKAKTFRNRIFSSAHACGLQVDGFPQEAYQTYHEEKAKGGIGLSIFGGSSNVDIDSPNVFSQLNMGTDEIIPHLQKFTERMHAAGSGIMCQITHLGRRAEPYVQDWLPAIGPSPLRETLHRGIPREMDEYDIDRVVKAYAAAANRCFEGGLEGIETLAAGHLIGQFMSPRTNQRSDHFGGSFENRMRFPLMVHAAIRKAVGDDFLIGMRLSVDESSSGGLSAEECVRMAKLLADEGLIDFYDAIYGTFDTFRSLSEEVIPGMGNAIAPWVKNVGAFKREIGLPVFHAGRISDLTSARFAVGDGHLDMAGMTRPHMADPQIVNKLMRGEEDRVRPCVGAQHCQAVHRPKCIHNAATGRELTIPHHIPKAEILRKAVVVGAGPAGLEAARVLALRGHDVALYEAASAPGGQVIVAAQEDWRRDLIGIVDWRVAELERLGVHIHYNMYMETTDISAQNPDLVILATGGIPQTDFGEGSQHVVSSWEILNREIKLANEVIIFDGTGRHPAPSVAKFAHQEGVRLHYVALDNTIGMEMSYAEAARWRKLFSQMGIVPTYEKRPVKVEREGNRLKVSLMNDLTNVIEPLEVDQVVVEMGSVPMNELFDGLREMSGNKGVTNLEKLVAVREYPKLCVWCLAHAGFTVHLLNRSGYRIANWLRAATHSLTHLPAFSKFRIAR